MTMTEDKRMARKVGSRQTSLHEEAALLKKRCGLVIKQRVSLKCTYVRLLESNVCFQDKRRKHVLPSECSCRHLFDHLWTKSFRVAEVLSTKGAIPPVIASCILLKAVKSPQKYVGIERERRIEGRASNPVHYIRWRSCAMSDFRPWHRRNHVVTR